MKNKLKSYFLHPFPFVGALLISLFFITVPFISQWVSSYETYSGYAGKQATVIANAIQNILIYPFGKWLKGSHQYLVVFPYWLVLLLLIQFVVLKYKRLIKISLLGFVVVLFLLYCFPNVLLFGESPNPSQSIGSVSNGKIRYSKRLPFRGKNFTTYSFPGYLAGRTFVHDKLRKTILETYEKCLTTTPDRVFLIGETGRRHGGLFLPHRTHRNGLSVDFMTPLLKNGKPYTSHHIFNLWAYGFEFDNNGRWKKISIDYETMAQHLLALQATAKENGLAIQKVIFDPVLRPYLLATPTGKKIKHLPFTKNRVIVRHDDHYHIDFKVLGK